MTKTADKRPCPAVSQTRVAGIGTGLELHPHYCNGRHDVEGAHFCPVCRLWWWRRS